MYLQPRPNSAEVDDLLLNARLRDEIEPFADESLDLLNIRDLPTEQENEYLASMLAWERAPVLPIAQWFEPELKLPRPETLPDAELHRELWAVIGKLYEKRVVLEFTDHLSDRELYLIIFRDILPSPEKKIELADNWIYWNCAQPDGDPETWLRYYATPMERAAWSEETGLELPPCEPPPYPRNLPRG